MSFGRMLRKAMGTPTDERRKSPRVRCRLNCTVRKDRKRFPARVLDVSGGGLCLLSPIQLPLRKSVVISIEVPPLGPVEVEAVTWHIHPVKSGRAGKKTWSIGLTLTHADAGYETLLPRPEQVGQVLEPEPDTHTEPREGGGSEIAADVGAVVLSDEWEESSPGWEKLFSEAETLLEEAGADDCELQLYRVRIKAANGPRTRTIALSAASEDEARSLARQDLDDSWKILEVIEA